MRGISEEILKEIIEKATLDGNDLLTTVYTQLLNRYCQELQEPWMALDEFLKSGSEGLCWVYLSNKYSGICEYSEGVFKFRYGVILKDNITNVMPIHKPEPPR